MSAGAVISWTLGADLPSGVLPPASSPATIGSASKPDFAASRQAAGVQLSAAAVKTPGASHPADQEPARDLTAAGGVVEAAATSAAESSLRFDAFPEALPATFVIGQAGGFVINVTFDSTVTSQPNAAAIEAAFNTAVSYFTSTFTCNVTDKIKVKWGNTGLGSSSTVFSTDFTYAQVRDALLGLPGQSANQQQAYGTLPTTGALTSALYAMATAEARLLGLGSFLGNDGTITFNGNQPWTFDPAHRAVAGAYDFISVALHEISEVLGRTALVASGTGAFAGQYEPLDLFRWSAAGIRQLSETGNPSYFSIDSGTTNLKSFNNHSGIGLNINGDLGDWLGTNPYTPDAYNASTPKGVENPVTAVDDVAMNILGYQIACYCRGTMIRTDIGEVPVEHLAIGDRVMTPSGALRSVKWIGRRSYAGRFIAGKRAVLPIRVKAGALGPGLPARDLFISPEHALFLGGVLAPARLLVNRLSIVQESAVEWIDYFHLELDRHDVILAEGAPAETYVDCDNRGMFQNAAEFRRLYPLDAPAPWRFCAPRAEPGSLELRAIREQILAQGLRAGYATRNPDLHLIADDSTVRPSSTIDRVYRFVVAPGSRALWLASRSWIPAETAAASQDRRRLGVAVERIILRHGKLRVDLDPASPALGEGFHAPEPSHRWTDGMGRLRVPALRRFPGEPTLEVHLAETDPFYPATLAPMDRPPAAPRRRLRASARAA